MTQINRIKLFVSDLLDGQLSERQCAIVLGEDKEKKKEKKEKGKKKTQTERTDTLNCYNSDCTNVEEKKCGKRNDRCTNGGSTTCLESQNQICTNTQQMLL